MRPLLHILFLIPAFVFGQDSSKTSHSKDFYEMSLQDLMDIKVSVASAKEMTAEESPGIVTLITKEEIKNSGATDLIDVLKTVPGIDFGSDVEGVVGIGIRGNWSNEGKVLFLVDGLVMNEGLYSGNQYGGHFSVDNIERIEIIRGPGSVIYGDNAEYAVINVISKQPENINGINISSAYSQMSNSYANRNLSICTGEKLKNIAYSISGYSGQSIRSQDNYIDVSGNGYTMQNQSEINNKNINGYLAIKNFEVRTIYDSYNLFTRDGYQNILLKSYSTWFHSFLAEAKNKIIISDKFSVTPVLNYKSQLPWYYDGPKLETQFAPFKIQSERTEGKILIDYNPNTQFNLLAGTSLFKDEATQKLPRQIFNSTQTTTLSYTNYSAFAQIMAKTGIANFAAGARYNTNSIYPPSFVPRLSVTKTFGKAHIKILYSKAFRAPNTENIDLNNAIKPENTTVAEIETGIHIGSHLSISTNAFYIQTRDPIIYYYDQPNDRDAYINLDKMGTRGFEAELKYKLQKQFASINYSFYTALNQDDRLSVYMVPQNRNAFLAFPQHKLYIYGGRELAKELYINMAISIYGPRYAIFQIDENGEPVYTNIPAKAYTSIYINKANCFTKNMAASVGVNNLFDEQQWYIQPYNSLHAPLPGLSRQFVIKVSYSFSNKK